MENAHDLVYLNTGNYSSYRSLKSTYLTCLLVSGIMVFLSFSLLQSGHSDWHALFPLISAIIWCLLGLSLLLVLRSKKTKKTFRLRFLVNGISELLLSALFWLLFASICPLADGGFIGFDFCLWVLPFYALFSAFYIFLIVLGVRAGIYRKMKEKGQTKWALAISGFFAALTPVAGICGRQSAKWLMEHASRHTQAVSMAVCLVLLVFLPALGHINFVQHFYCKKYNILCDENGNTTSPKLEPQAREKRPRRVRPPKTAKKKIPLLLKILIGILAVPIAFFVVVFTVALVKVISNRM